MDSEFVIGSPGDDPVTLFCDENLKKAINGSSISKRLIETEILQKWHSILPLVVWEVMFKQKRLYFFLSLDEMTYGLLNFRMRWYCGWISS